MDHLILVKRMYGELNCSYYYQLIETSHCNLCIHKVPQFQRNFILCECLKCHWKDYGPNIYNK